jgi:hypothetical protein
MGYKHTFEYSIFEEYLNIDEKILKNIKKHPLTKYDMNSNNFCNKDKKLLNMIKKKLENVLKKHKLNIIDCWIQLYLKNNYHSVHTHFSTQKDYSFVWFIEGDKTSSPVIFYEIGYPLLHNNKQIKFDFKPGTLLIFPGFIPHEVPPNKSNNRLIVSGNAI